MTTIVTRAGKGSPLTNNEVDANFVNLNDAKIETLTSTDSSVTITGTGSSRNLSVPLNPDAVSGPASSTDNAVARFDGTTGKLIQNSVVTIDDAGNVTGVNSITFDITPSTTPTTTGTIFWDEGNKSPSVNIDADVVLQLGQEMLALVYNNSGSTITNGSVVAVNGAQGQRPAVILADAAAEATSAPTLGIATEDIAAGAEGFITTFGFVRGLNTAGFTAGAPVYLSQTPGQFTSTRPTAPAHTVALGWVIKVNASSGEVFVNINNGWELDELHNVLISSPISGNTLIYDAVAGVWKNASLTAGTGISVTNGAGSITVTNTAPDQVVALTGAGTTTVTGTYPNFTITSTDSAAGTVTNVSATAPISVANGSTTPSITITQAGAAADGYLTSTDWNTFNDKYDIPSQTGNTGKYLTTDGSSTSWGTVDALPPQTGETGKFLTTDGTDASWATVDALPSQTGNATKFLTTDGTTASWESVGGGTITTTDFTATSGQTVFTVNYTVGSTEVYQNGVKLGTTDFTATNGTSITLATGATVGDLVEVVTFSNLNLYSLITEDSFSGDGTTTAFTMTAVPANAASALIVISGVTQDPSSYTVSGNILTFSTAPPTGTDNISVRYLGVAAAGAVSTFSGGTTGLTPASATTGAVTLAGTLAASNGGTGLTSPGTSGNVLTSNGTAWVSSANPPAFSSGTVMLFVQTSAPTGWTKSTANNDKALRIVSGTASTGGSVAFTTAFASQTPAGSVSTSITGVSGSVGATGSATVSGTSDATTLSTSQIPSHAHDYTTRTIAGEPSTNSNISRAYTNSTPQTYSAPAIGSTGGGGSHTHTFTSGGHTHTSGAFTFSSGTASSSFTGSALNLAVQYVDAIIATKD